MNHSAQMRRKLFLFSFVLALALTTILVPWPAPSEAEAQEPDFLFDAARSGQERAFQRLLRTTYLGHAAELPDRGEPVAVLEKYLEIQRHDDKADRKALDKRVNDWRKLARQYPNSRYALLGLAKTYRDRGAFTGQADLRRAVDSFLRANEIGVGQGRLLFTRQISELMVQLDDLEGLDDSFGTLLKASGKAETRRGEQYAVLV